MENNTWGNPPVDDPVVVEPATVPVAPQLDDDTKWSRDLGRKALDHSLDQQRAARELGRRWAQVAHLADHLLRELPTIAAPRFTHLDDAGDESPVRTELRGSDLARCRSILADARSTFDGISAQCYRAANRVAEATAGTLHAIGYTDEPADDTAADLAAATGTGL